MPEAGDSWTEYRKLVVQELERLDHSISQLSTKIDEFMRGDISKIKIDIAMLQVKAGVWGVLGGVLTVLAAVLLSKFR